MHSFTKIKKINYDAHLVHSIVMDIENYPKFLPWCNSAIILSKKKYIAAKLNIQYKIFSESYISKVLSQKIDNGYKVTVESISGPFNHLNNIWYIKSLNNATEVEFFIDFELKSKIVNKVIDTLWSNIVEKIMIAFESRARELSL